MNAPILTAEGGYEYKESSVSICRELIESYKNETDGGCEVMSAVGHQATADILTDLFGMEVPMNRINYQQETGDTAIVFKLNKRPEEGKILTKEEMMEIGYKIYVMEKFR